ncbi:YbjN domain-containing protein [Rhodococcoides fascians]|uniref:YbjN domain-containing protein n=1 Tax=Rhodococcoides fascians TaxID=1828 RepID=UPI00050CE2B1|nr:YbjN domain-containing protein [Rhodococcus fascians]
MSETAELIDRVLKDRELDYTRRGEVFTVELPGERKLKTTTMVTVGHHGVRIEAFVCRKPDENFEGVYKYLLRRNRRLYGVHYTIDKVGDIYLVGRMSLRTVDGDELDRIFGQTLEAADGDFNVLLELGFAESIKREWAWRVSRGESLANLKAFEHLVASDSSDEPEHP